jgi:hypothetical protein
MKYTIVIQWSDEDQCYVVSLPEWGEFCHTHGDTYAATPHIAVMVRYAALTHPTNRGFA